MKKVKLGDMSYADRKEYRYYKRVLQDLSIFGFRYLKEVAEDRVAIIESKYSRSETNAEN